MPTARPDSALAFSLADATALLARTPAVLDVWLRGLSDDWLRANEGGESWSPYDVLGHFIHGEKTDWIPRLRRMLEYGTSLPFDKFDRFAQFRDSEGKSAGDLLDEFARLRGESLAELAVLAVDDAALDRRGRHPELGEVTARELLATWVAHDLDHLMQVARVLAHRHASEVGPWRRYLRIVSGQPG